MLGLPDWWLLILYSATLDESIVVVDKTFAILYVEGSLLKVVEETAPGLCVGLMLRLPRKVCSACASSSSVSEEAALSMS